MFEESVSFIPSIWASMNSWFTPTVLFVFLNLMIGTIAITSSLATQKPTHEQQQHKQQHHQDHHNHIQQQQFDRSPSMLKRLKSINFSTFRSQEATTNYTQTPLLNTHFTSFFNSPHEHELQQQQQTPPSTTTTPHFTRSPSVLQRLKSINFSQYLSPELTKTQEPETHYSPVLQQQTHHQEQENHLEPEEEEETKQDEDKEEAEAEQAEEHDHFQDQQTLDEIYKQLKGGGGGHVSRTTSDTKPASGELPKKLPKKMKKSASTKSPFSHFEEDDIVESRRPMTVKEGKTTQMVDDEQVDAKADDFINKFKQQLKLQRMDSIMRYKDMIGRGTTAGK